ncbi:MAG: glutathione S-transferase family protein [Henriciella sp.]|nr:glutathione S-transferase family protein [Henriciella sp.]
MQDKPILFMSPGSHHSRRVTLLVHELELELDERVVGVRPPGMGGENEQPEFLKINPAGKVPVLQDGELVLSESNAIMTYLAETYGPTPLWPHGAAERARIAQWQFFQAAHISPTADGLLYENVVKPMMGQAADRGAVERLTASFHRWCRVLETGLDADNYLTGAQLTCADLSVACAFMYDRAAQLPLAEHPPVQAWYKRIQSRPSWVATEPPTQPLEG